MTSISSNQTLQDGTGVGSPSLLYDTSYPQLVGADSLQRSGITGRGVTIAVLDSGLWQDPSQNFGSRVLASIDVTNGGSGAVQGDPYGHGTHVTSIAAGGAQSVSLSYSGIAPQANLVVVRAFDGTGGGRYTDVIAGLNWIVANRDRYNIRVLNLSFGAQPQSYYWDDPVNQAVMAAWRAGIVVVAAAGNEGPSPMTIDVPGNVPYVITAGALTDNYTPYDGTDDRLASFSSAGPTFEGFVKPELVAPGGHMAASMPSNSYLANIDPGSMSPGEQMFTMSGTSQAAAVTSGVVALMLQSNPGLTPDTVKCRLLASTRPAVTSGGNLAYSVFQQGAGLINAPAAVNSSATNCANQGLDINADLAGTTALRRARPIRTRTATTTSWTSTAARPGPRRCRGTGSLGPRVIAGTRAIPGLRAIPGPRVTPGRRATRGPRDIPGRRATLGPNVTPGPRICRGGPTLRGLLEPHRPPSSPGFPTSSDSLPCLPERRASVVAGIRRARGSI